MPTIPDEAEVRPMYVRKADVGAYGRTPHAEVVETSSWRSPTVHLIVVSAGKG